MSDHRGTLKTSTRTLLDLAPFLEMPPHDLFRLCASARLFYPTNVQRPVLSLEATHTSHIVTVVGKLVPREAVLGRVWRRQ